MLGRASSTDVNNNLWYMQVFRSPVGVPNNWVQIGGNITCGGGYCSGSVSWDSTNSSDGAYYVVMVVYDTHGTKCSGNAVNGTTDLWGNPVSDFGDCGASSRLTASIVEPGCAAVVWTNTANVSIESNSLMKNAGGSNWNAGAVSNVSITSGDVRAQMYVDRVGDYKMFGLGHGDSNQSYTDIDFAIFIRAEGYLEIWENGTYKAYAGAYGAGDWLKVAVESGVVRYYRMPHGSGTWSLLYTSSVAPVYPLLLDTSIYYQNTALYYGYIGNTTCPTGWLNGGPEFVQREGDASEKGEWLAGAQGYHSTVYQVDEVDASPATVLSVPSGQTWRKYYYATGQRVAMRVVTNSSDTPYFLSGDHLGSTSLATSNSGAVVAQVQYKAFGEIRSSTGTLPTDYKFTGQRQESLTGGLYDYGARYYDVVIGRFISADTVVPSASNPQTLNRYSYVANSPLKYIDPSGHSPEDYYVFVQGCVEISGGGDPCTNQPELDWHNYIDYLKQTFSVDDDWVSAHVSFVRARNSDPGGIAAAVSKLDPGNGSIFLVGHSAGGSAIANYLNRLRDAGTSPRIGGAFMIDAPIGDENVWQALAAHFADFDRYSETLEARPYLHVEVKDNLGGLGTWALGKGIPVLTVSYLDDFANPARQVADIPFKPIPVNAAYALPDFFSDTKENIRARHSYLLVDPSGARGLLDYLFGAQLLR